MTNPLNYPITDPYGLKRTYTVNGVTYNDVHDGIDFAMPQGTPVTLPPGGGFDGKVTFAGLDQYEGAYVDVRANSDGGVARFLHLSRIDVHVGQQVTSNQQIGLSGGARDTWGAGLSTGAHLHFGLLVNNRAVDPLPWLKQAYNSTPPPPQPNPEFKKIFPDIGSGLWALCKKAGYPVIPTNQPNPEPTNSICYNRIEELNGTRSVIAGREYTVDFDPVKWFATKAIELNKPQAEAITTPAQPTMPSISIEELKPEPVLDLDSEIYKKGLEEKIKELESEKVARMKADQLAKDFDLDKFDFNKLIVGVISGKNPITNSAFFLGLAGVYAFYNQNQESINLAVGLIGQGLALIYPLVRKYLESIKK